MSRIKKVFDEKWFYVVAFCLPCIVAVVHSIVADTWLTGNGTFFRGDTYGWSVMFYNELWECVHKGESLVYGWNIAGGYDIWLHILNSAMSPFTILIIMTPKTWIANWVHIMMIVHWGSIAFTMTYFFYNTKHNGLKHHKKLVSLCLGLVFAMSNGMVNFLGYLQYGITMILFPILLLLLERLVINGKWKLYYVILTCSIIANFYISYHICLFLIIWYFVNLTNNKKNDVKRFFVFAGSSILSAVTSAFVIIPSFLISFGRYNVENSLNAKGFCRTILVGITEFIEQFFILQPIAPVASMDPNIYCTLFVVMLALFILFVKMNKGKKIYFIVVTCILVCSFFFGYLNIVWHCFAVPNLVYHRFVNVFIFWLLFLTLYVLQQLQEVKLWNVVVILCGCIIGFTVTFLSIKEFQAFYIYLLTILLIVLYGMLMILFVRRSIQYKHMLFVISSFIVIEACINSFFSFSAYNVTDALKEPDVFENVEMTEGLEMETGGRIIYLEATENTGMLTSKPSVSGFSSYMNQGNIDFLEKMGVGAYGNVKCNLDGASPLVNLMYNVHYTSTMYEVSVSDSELVDERDNFKLYKTNRIAGLGYMVQEDITQLEYLTDMVFDNQNEFVRCAVDGKQIFEYVLPGATCVNAYGIPKEINESYKNYGIYLVEYMSEDSGIEMRFEMEEEMDLYLFYCDMDCPFVAVSVNDELVCQNLSANRQETIHIGDVKKGDIVSIAAVPAGSMEVYGQPYFTVQLAKFNEENYAEAYEKLSRDIYEVEVMDGPYVSGTIDVTEDGIMATSIQAVDGFEVFVDGAQVEYEKIGNALIGVPLTKGTHKVEFKYHTPYAKLGWIISGCGFALFIILCIVGRKKDVSVLCESE